MADSQAELQKEIEELRAENESLRKQVDDLEETLGIGPTQPDDRAPPNAFKLPSEEEIDQAFDFLENMLSKLRQRMEKLEKQHKVDDGGTPL